MWCIIEMVSSFVISLICIYLHRIAYFRYLKWYYRSCNKYLSKTSYWQFALCTIQTLWFLGKMCNGASSGRLQENEHDAQLLELSRQPNVSIDFPDKKGSRSETRLHRSWVLETMRWGCNVREQTQSNKRSAVVGATTKTTTMEVRWSTAAMHDDNGGEKKCKGRRLGR
jgi:hypothetical protein